MRKKALLLLAMLPAMLLAACGGSEEEKKEAPPPLYENPPFGADDIDSAVNEARQRMAPADRPAAPPAPTEQSSNSSN